MNFSTQVAEQAVHWLMEMQQGALNPRQQAAWQHWLNAHSEHQRAWDHMQRVNQRLRGMPSPLAHAALNAPTSTNRRQALKLLLILGAGSAAAWSLRQQHILPPLTADYRSPVGQRRKVQLADGSQLHLNTGSAVDVHFDGQQRLIRLLEGEILLTGVKGPTPLKVLTGQGLLSSQTARLNVRQFNDHTQLAVLDGHVDVMPNTYSGLPLTVDAAHQVNFTRKGWDTPRATWTRNTMPTAPGPPAATKSRNCWPSCWPNPTSPCPRRKAPGVTCSTSTGSTRGWRCTPTPRRRMCNSR